MIVETDNSVYKIEALGKEFKVTKLSGNPKHTAYLSVGESRLHKMVALQVGYFAQFDGVRTSTVKSIKE